MLAVGLLAVPSVMAQTLARPGWAGSGLNGEPWWRSAVFYRVDPATFQDSDGDGIGDLPGLVSRLEYLQTLGVDALILEGKAHPATSLAGSPPISSPGPAGVTSAPKSAAPALPFALIDEPGFDDLLTEASRRHLRIIVAQPISADPSILLARARSALTRGAAGIELTPFPSLPVPGPSASTGTVLLLQLRSLAASFPGERVILSDLEAMPGASGTAAAPRSVRWPGSLSLHAGEAPQLTALSLSNQPVSSPEAAAALRALVATSETLPAGAAPLFQVEGRSPAPSDAVARALPLPAAAFLAVRLLSLRGALSIDAGQELGLAAASAFPGSTSSAPALLMQWTPRNITPPAVKIEPNPDPAPTRSDVYGAYRPYIPVKPQPVTLPGTPSPPPPPDSLPGFTSAQLPSLPSAALDTARRNVAVEDLDPRSQLNLYRRLVALHHGHATLRTGSTAVLELPVSGALVWARRAPAGARTVASVLVACNLSDSPLSLSLDAELTRAHIRPGLLRPLLGTASAPNGPQSTALLSLPPHAIYIGEIYHH